MKDGAILRACTQTPEHENGMSGITHLHHSCLHCHGLQKAMAW
jgi:hypothetical protein